MSDALAHTILQRAYQLDSVALDTQAHTLGAGSWAALTSSLHFTVEGTGGGCQALTSSLPLGHTLVLTDGEAGLPTSVERFWMGILDEADEELVSLP